MRLNPEDGKPQTRNISLRRTSIAEGEDDGEDLPCPGSISGIYCKAQGLRARDMKGAII